MTRVLTHANLKTRMNNNKENILDCLIKEHIRTGIPVGSNILVEKYSLDISPATARQRLAELEQEGLITQPHTSAGRIPTEAAYNLFIDKINTKKISKKNLSIDITDDLDHRKTAKQIAKMSNLAVFWALHKHNLYYTGISNLLSQPEFAQLNRVYDISNIIDEIDEIIDNIYNKIKIGPQILIGTKNPFGEFCGTILTKYKTNSGDGMFGIIGPLRMDYEKNLNLINYIFEKIN